MERFRSGRPFTLVVLFIFTVVLGGASALAGLCGPFTDTAADAFCPFVLEVFYLGITTGTTPATYDPAGNVTRLQMAAFLSRTVDRTLQRGSRRAAMNQFWTPRAAQSLGVTTIPGNPIPLMPQSDGEDVWVSSNNNGTVSRVHGSDGKLLQTWTGASEPFGVLVAMGRIFISDSSPSGALLRIDPTQPAGTVTTVASGLGNGPTGIAFDGVRIWTANYGGSVAIVTPGPSLPWTATTVTTGFTSPLGTLYDGASLWVTDYGAGKLFKLDGSGGILLTVTVGAAPGFPIFDGTNIWVPSGSDGSVSIVRASNGAVLSTLTGNGLGSPQGAAFDGQRVLVTSMNPAGLSLWKAADLTALGSIALEETPWAACSDGFNFWITLNSANKLLKF